MSSQIIFAQSGEIEWGEGNSSLRNLPISGLTNFVTQNRWVVQKKNDLLFPRDHIFLTDGGVSGN